MRLMRLMGLNALLTTIYITEMRFVGAVDVVDRVHLHVRQRHQDEDEAVRERKRR